MILVDLHTNYLMILFKSFVFFNAIASMNKIELDLI